MLIGAADRNRTCLDRPCTPSRSQSATAATASPKARLTATGRLEKRTSRTDRVMVAPDPVPDITVQCAHQAKDQSFRANGAIPRWSAINGRFWPIVLQRTIPGLLVSVSSKMRDRAVAWANGTLQRPWLSFFFKIPSFRCIVS
jgi:hypothetical protein